MFRKDTKNKTTYLPEADGPFVLTGKDHFVAYDLNEHDWNEYERNEKDENGYGRDLQKEKIDE